MAKKKGRGRAKVNKSCPKQDKPNNSIDDHDVVATSLADTTLETTKPKGKRKRTNEKIVAMRLVKQLSCLVNYCLVIDK